LPTPKEYEMDKQSDKHGVISLRLAIAGIILPIILSSVFLALQDSAAISSSSPYVGLSALLFIGLQMAAIVTGQKSKHTPSGKVGFRLARYCLVVPGMIGVLATIAWYLP
jgi:hypothetical protein